MTDMMYQTAGLGSGGDTEDNTTGDYPPYGTSQMTTNNNIQPRQRFPGLYVGNLTWWTTDRDVIDAINSFGVTDVQEVKFFENRNNGQSKGFCMVTFSSEASLPVVIEKLPQKELHGQSPIVTPYNRQNLSIFEAQTKPRSQINQAPNGPSPHAAGIMGINSITSVYATPSAQAGGLGGVGGIPYTGLNAAPTIGGFNQAPAGINAMGGMRPTFPNQQNFRMSMHGPRPMMRGTFGGNINNGPMMQGGHRMRFMQPQNWNNMSAMGPKQVDYGLDRHRRDDRVSLRRDDDREPSRRDEDRASSRRDDDRVSARRDDDRVSTRRDDDRLSSRRDDDRLSSRRDDDRVSSRRDDDRVASRRDDDRVASRRDEDRVSSRRDDDRSSRHRSGGTDDIRREKSSSSSRHKDSRSHLSDERVQTRSRSRSRDKSRHPGKERWSTSERDGHRDRDRERERDRRERR